jgi:WD40 repeat protein
MSDFFLSYSRRDQEWVHRLAGALKEKDREALVDVEDIFPSEKWRERLEQMITESHGFVFVLSNESVNSEECSKELAFAHSLGKRILLLNHNLSDGDMVSAELAELQWIDASPKRDITEVALGLCMALDTDIKRVRFHTSLAIRTAAWKKSPDKVLRGSELIEAEAFIKADQANPAPTEDQKEFVRASRMAARKRRQRLIVAAAVALIAIIIAAVIAQTQRRASKCNASLAEAEKLITVDAAGARKRVIEASEYCAGSGRDRLDGLVSRLLVSPRPITRIGPTSGSAVLLSEDGQYLAAGPNRASLLTGSESGLEIWRYTDRVRIAALDDWSLPPASLSVTEKSVFVVDTVGRLVLLDHADGRLLGETRLDNNHGQKIINERLIDVSRDNYRPINVVRVWESDGSRISFDLHAGMNGPEVLDPRMEFRAKADGDIVRLYRKDQESQRLTVTSQGGLYAIASIAISPDGDLIIAATEVGIEIWARDGKRVALFHDPEAKMRTWTVAFDPAGTRLVTTQGTANHATIWDLADIKAAAQTEAGVVSTPQRPLVALRGNVPLIDARFGPTPTIIATKQRSGHVMVWETGLPAARFDFIPKRSMASLMPPGGWRLSKTGQVWKLESQLDMGETIELKEATQLIDPSGRIVLYGQSDGGVAELRLKTVAGETQLLNLTDHLRFVDLLGFSKSGRYFAVGSIRGSERRIIVYRCSACGLDPEASLSQLQTEQNRVGE